MTSEIETTSASVANYKFRSEIPKEHCTSADTKLRWLWNQRLGTVQTIWQKTVDGDTKLAATLCLNAAFTGDMTAIGQLIHRLEGGALTDEDLLDYGLDTLPI